MALFCGGLVQLLAGMWEFAVGNTFGATGQCFCLLLLCFHSILFFSFIGFYSSQLFWVFAMSRVSFHSMFAIAAIVCPCATAQDWNRASGDSESHSATHTLWSSPTPRHRAQIHSLPLLPTLPLSSCMHHALLPSPLLSACIYSSNQAVRGNDARCPGPRVYLTYPP